MHCSKVRVNLSSQTQYKRSIAREKMLDFYHKFINTTNLTGLGKLTLTFGSWIKLNIFVFSAKDINKFTEK